MEVKNQFKLRFLGVDISNVNFNSMNPFSNQTNIDLSLTPKVFYPEEAPNHFKIIMDLQLNCKDYFVLTLLAIGSFEFDLEQTIDEKQKKAFINVNAPAIMFPYIRSFITSFTSQLGMATVPLVLPTQFFNGELEEFKQSSLE